MRVIPHTLITWGGTLHSDGFTQTEMPSIPVAEERDVKQVGFAGVLCADLKQKFSGRRHYHRFPLTIT